jgi:hypothetical protein
MDPLKLIAVLFAGGTAFGILLVVGAPVGAALLLGAVASIVIAAFLRDPKKT